MKSRILFIPELSLQCSLAISSVFLLSCAAIEAAEFKFDFGADNPQPGFIQVAPETAYDSQKHFGFLQDAAAAPGQPKVFAVDVEEGNYNVSIRFGDPKLATSTTIKAESRRLMIEKVETAPGQFETRTFTVNVRKPAISTGGKASLNSRELGPPATPDWDDHLTFEFNGKHPGVASMEIKPAKDAITVFLAGDSTVTDQANEPYAGWGQMLPRFFGQPRLSFEWREKSPLKQAANDSVTGQALRPQDCGLRQARETTP